MTLRRATDKDFEACKIIQDTDRADVLYYDFERAKEETTPSNSLTENYFFSEEDLKLIELELDFTVEKFTRYLNDKYSKIYVFEDEDKNVIAYVLLFKMQRCSWKLVEMQIQEKCQTMEVFTQILNDLMNEKTIKEIDVCTFVDSTIKKLLAIGYHQINKGYFRRNKKLE